MNKILYGVLTVAMLMLVVAALLPIVGYHHAALKYVYATGAALTFIVRIFTKYDDNLSLRIKRLHRMENVSAMCYCVSAFFLFYTGAGATDWLGFLTAGAALQAYAGFMIDYLEKRDKKRQ